MPDETNNAVDEFFSGLPSEDKQVADIFAEATGTDTTIPAKGNAGAEVEASGEEEPHKNRRHRRLEAALAKEREARIAAEARAEGRAEGQRESVAPGEVDPRLVQMYGDNTAAIKLHQGLLEDSEKRAEERALARFEARQAEKTQEDAQLDSLITGELESLEDKFNVDLTSDSPAARKLRTDYLEFVERVSPKDQNGLVTDFADFDSSWDIFQSTRKATGSPTAARAKEIAGRSMQAAGTGVTPPKVPTPGFDGWKRDLGLE